MTDTTDSCVGNDHYTLHLATCHLLTSQHIASTCPNSTFLGVIAAVAPRKHKTTLR